MMQAPVGGSLDHRRLSANASLDAITPDRSLHFQRKLVLCPMDEPMPGIDFRELRSLVSMAEVLTLLGFEAETRRGEQVRGPCPLHGSADRSRVFSVNLSKNTFQCFKCAAAGNQLDLWASATNKPLYEAALDLCRRLNRDIPYVNHATEKRNP
jgi:DNA primase